ncbi:hypothetical protein OG777_07805 [Micromonospora peucetia]|uniref:hypothetical protein n=1 Tax=Micromonospora peucetia TaxID=47871 RepID=UPI002253254D|nr:hypothetical protein [Micromonospora peucetia]MCX4386832.1 hypothetical protein [Micromonospora peucetia]
MKVVPDRCQAAIWCGAGEGLRLGEVLGLENSERCIDRSRQELHVVQQLRFHKGQYGGFYLARPKSGSVGDVDLDDHVALALGEHVRKYPPALVELPDITGGTPDPGKQAKRRTVSLLFTDDQGKPIQPDRRAERATAFQPADHAGDVCALVAEEEPAPQHRQHSASRGCG